MAISLNSSTESLAAYRAAKGNGVSGSKIDEGQAQEAADEAISLPAILPKQSSTSGTRLVSETHIDLENGYRRSRTFEKQDGRTFTRIEDVTVTADSARRSVIQQNPSGSVTRYEEVLDREEAGTFRRTQRFQDEGGEVTAQITDNYQVTDPFVLSGGMSGFSYPTNSVLNAMRGTQLDLRV